MHTLDLRRLLFVTFFLNAIFIVALGLPLVGSGFGGWWDFAVSAPHLCVQADVLTMCE